MNNLYSFRLKINQSLKNIFCVYNKPFLDFSDSGGNQRPNSWDSHPFSSYSLLVSSFFAHCYSVMLGMDFGAGYNIDRQGR